MMITVHRSDLMKKIISLLLASASFTASAASHVPMTLVDATGTGASVGTITITQTPYGLVFTPALKDLPPGLHGFHVHQNPSCAPKEKDGKMVAALAAGGHLDLTGSNKHGEPWGDGHLGDLPPLYVAADGTASQPVLAPRLKPEHMLGRSLMLHIGGDNHADHPVMLGGGGARMACGVVQAG